MKLFSLLLFSITFVSITLPVFDIQRWAKCYLDRFVVLEVVLSFYLMPYRYSSTYHQQCKISATNSLAGLQHTHAPKGNTKNVCVTERERKRVGKGTRNDIC
jgi:hypothetical protein